jgi:hypothetical protein
MSVEDFIREAVKRREFQGIVGRERLTEAIVEKFHMSHLEAALTVERFCDAHDMGLVFSI